MKIKTPLEFQPFKDGICNIYTTDEYGDKSYKYEGICFDNKTIGYRRVYAAKAAQSNISRVISIPMLNNLDNFDKVEILGEDCYYSVEIIQEVWSSNPPSILLTLNKVGIQQ